MCKTYIIDKQVSNPIKSARVNGPFVKIKYKIIPMGTLQHNFIALSISSTLAIPS